MPNSPRSRRLDSRAPLLERAAVVVGAIPLLNDRGKQPAQRGRSAAGAGPADSVSDRLRSRFRRPHPALVVLLVLAALQGIGWSVATAPFNGPDEGAHFAYVQYLAETGDDPSRDTGPSGFSTEMRTAYGELGLYTLIGNGSARPAWTELDEVEGRLDQLPDSAREDGPGPNPAGDYPPLYYAAGAIAYRLSPNTSILARVEAVRLLGVALLVLTVAMTWMLAAELFTRTWPRVVMTGMVALQPKLGFIAGIVNPDIALVAETTALLVVAFRTVKLGPSTGRVLALGLLAGAGVLTHGRGLALIPPAAIALLIGLVRFRSALPSLKVVVPGAVALLACGLFAVAYTRGDAGGGAAGAAFGGQASIASEFNVRQFISSLYQFYFPKLSSLEPRLGPPYGYRQVFVEGFWGTYGSLEVNLRAGIYDALQLASAFGLLGLWTAAAVRWREVRARWGEVLVALATFGSMLLLLHIVSYQSLLTGTDPVITGRYLLASVALYGAAIAFVCSSLGRRFGPLLGALLLGLSAVLSVGAIGIELARFHG